MATFNNIKVYQNEWKFKINHVKDRGDLWISHNSLWVVQGTLVKFYAEHI